MIKRKLDVNYDREEILKITRLGHINRYKLAQKILKQQTDVPIDVLDAACGYGYGCYMLSKDSLVNEVVGIDIDAEVLDKAKERYSRDNIYFQCGDLEKKIQTNKKFGMVTSMETIEHTDKPLDVLKNLYDVMEPDGILVMSTPNGKNVSENIKKIIKENKNKLPKGVLHVKEYTQQEMREMLENTGFRVEQEYGMYTLFGYVMKITGILANSTKNSGVGGLKTKIIQTILDNIPFVSEIFSKPYPFLVNSSKSIIYVATKK